MYNCNTDSLGLILGVEVFFSEGHCSGALCVAFSSAVSDAHTKHSYLSYLVLSKYLALKIVLAIHVLSNKMYCFID